MKATVLAMTLSTSLASGLSVSMCGGPPGYPSGSPNFVVSAVLVSGGAVVFMRTAIVVSSQNLGTPV
jgi:hypothetical protein